MSENHLEKLNDSAIRPALISYLSERRSKPLAILEELRVHNGNAIADIVTIHDEAHCYEIKGETDNISRLKKQGAYYDMAFRRITLVTTENHISNALNTIPEHWGLMLVTKKEDGLVLKKLKEAKISPEFDKEKAALTLWKEEMLSLLPPKKEYTRRPRDLLANLISENYKKIDVSKNISSALLQRYC